MQCLKCSTAMPITNVAANGDMTCPECGKVWDAMEVLTGVARS
jgi:uncharacterized Zn finger protein